MPTIKGFSIAKEAEVDAFFLEFFCFLCDPMDVGSLISGPSAFFFNPAISIASSDDYFDISFSWGWFWSLPPVQCYEPPPTVLQALCLSDLIPQIYLSLPLYKGLDLGHTWMA